MATHVDGMTTFDKFQHPRSTAGTFTDKQQTAPELALGANPYTDQDPPQIDAVLAKLSNAAAIERSKIAREEKAIADIESGKRRVNFGTTAESVIEAAHKRIAEYQEALDAVREKIAPITEEFDSRGGWTRFFVTTGSNPHVHSSRSCSTCYPTTQFGWLTDNSGMDEDEIVELAGDEACTVCFPTAPVADRGAPRQNRLETPEARASRTEREAAKAARDQKRAATSITAPSGGPVYDDWGSAFKTERGAELAAVGGLADAAWYGETHPSAPTWIRVAANVEEAIAAKRGVEAAEIRPQWEKKLRSKLKRDGANSVQESRVTAVLASIDAHHERISQLRNELDRLTIAGDSAGRAAVEDQLENALGAGKNRR